MKILRKIFLKLFKAQISRHQLNKVKSSNLSEIRVVIGSGYTHYKNWINTDIETINVTKYDDWNNYFEENTINTVLAEHIFEHLNQDELDLALSNIYKFLKKDGNLRIAVPDGYHTSNDYIEAVKPGGYGDGSHDHKFLFNYKMLTEILEKIGYKIRLLEYFDDKGDFHLNSWNEEDGKITRSALNDARNSNGSLKYTSLIIDGIKE